jgi:hypothetical protein
MKLFHGTQEWRANCIEKEGFLGSELAECTSLGKFVDGGVVYLAATEDEAAEYGDTILEVDLDGVEIHEFSDGNTHHFYAAAEDVNEQASWVRK